MSSEALTIFLAEDNEADVLLVRTALEEEGIAFRLDVLKDGEQVVWMLQQMASGQEEVNRPDLIMLDLNLPRYDGSEILELLQTNPFSKGVPVVVLTSSESPKDREHATNMGVDGYFRKPTDLEEFLRLGKVVRGVLEKRAAEASG